MSSAALSGRAGLPSRFHVVGANGVGEPRIPVGEVEPGMVVRFGIDDDMTCLVLANFADSFNDKHDTPARNLLYFGCMSEEPHAWEHNRLMSQLHNLTDSVSVVVFLP